MCAGWYLGPIKSKVIQLIVFIKINIYFKNKFNLTQPVTILVLQRFIFMYSTHGLVKKQFFFNFHQNLGNGETFNCAPPIGYKMQQYRIL